MVGILYNALFFLKVNRMSGNSIIFGTEADETLTGNSGIDLMSGRGGSDVVNGNAGNDFLIYDIDLNVGETDSYNGGNGRDTLVLVASSDTWFDATFQQDLADLAAAAAQGETTYAFSSIGLTIDTIENVRVAVDGQFLDIVDDPVTAMDDAVQISENRTMAVTGDPTGNDVAPDLIADISLVQGPSYGSITANGDGTFSYLLDTDDAEVDGLETGETLLEEIIYQITDANGDTDTATVSITIHGVSDTPDMTTADTVMADDFIF